MSDIEKKEAEIMNIENQINTITQGMGLRSETVQYHQALQSKLKRAKDELQVLKANSNVSAAAAGRRRRRTKRRKTKRSKASSKA